MNSLEHDLCGGDAVHLADADLAPVTGDADLATAATTLGIAVLTATG